MYNSVIIVTGFADVNRNALIDYPSATITKRVEKLHLDRAVMASSAHELTYVPVHCQRCLQGLRIPGPVSTSRPVPWRSEPTARPMLASGTTITGTYFQLEVQQDKLFSQADPLGPERVRRTLK